ncbi:MAG: Xaa-Pro peptidase family protein [Chloroflexota bacterium]
MAVPKFATDREERINYDRMRKFRLERAREQLKKAGLGALITWDAWNIRYLTGVYVTIPTRWQERQCVIFPVNGDPYVFGGGSGGPARMNKEMPWLKGKIYGYGKFPAMKRVNAPADMKGIVETTAKIMDEHGVKNQPLGIDGTTSMFVAQEAFKSVGITCVDGKLPMFEARKIKNWDEIECVRIACANAEAAFADIMDAIRPGVTECELVGVGMNRLYALGADETQEFVCISGELTNPFRIDYTDRQLRPGDLIIVDINGNSWQGYKSCYYRTFCCGKATSEQKETFEEARAMMYAGMAAIKAGNTTLDVCSKWPTDPKYWGYEKWEDVRSLATGHGIGIALHEIPNINLEAAKDNPVTLEEGMVLAVEIWTGKKGGNFAVRLEENVAVTKDGYDLLTTFPVDELIECWR